MSNTKRIIKQIDFVKLMLRTSKFCFLRRTSIIAVYFDTAAHFGGAVAVEAGGKTYLLDETEGDCEEVAFKIGISLGTIL